MIIENRNGHSSALGDAMIGDFIVTDLLDFMLLIFLKIILEIKKPA